MTNCKTKPVISWWIKATPNIKSLYLTGFSICMQLCTYILSFDDLKYLLLFGMYNAGHAASYWRKPVWGLTWRSCSVCILPTGGSSVHCTNLVTILWKLYCYIYSTSLLHLRKSYLYFFLPNMFKSLVLVATTRAGTNLPHTVSS